MNYDGAKGYRGCSYLLVDLESTLRQVLSESFGLLLVRILDLLGNSLLLLPPSFLLGKLLILRSLFSLFLGPSALLFLFLPNGQFGEKLGSASDHGATDSETCSLGIRSFDERGEVLVCRRRSDSWLGEELIDRVREGCSETRESSADKFCRRGLELCQRWGRRSGRGGSARCRRGRGTENVVDERDGAISMINADRELSSPGAGDDERLELARIPCLLRDSISLSIVQLPSLVQRRDQLREEREANARVDLAKLVQEPREENLVEMREVRRVKRVGGERPEDGGNCGADGEGVQVNFQDLIK